MKTLIFMRVLAAIVALGGAIWVISEGKEGWGWLIFAAVWLGSITISKGDCKCDRMNT